MLPKNYMSHYKCGCQKISQCICPRKKDISQIFMENINDIAESLAEVMIVCGIHPAKARATAPITVHGFLHYDEVRHRIDEVPQKRFSRECVFFLLANKCLMHRMEAQLAYSIMKRAFKAFYHGTDVGGIRNPVLEAQLIHSNECFWVHAANRTAQIFAQYEGLIKSAEKYYASKIICIYKHLYDRIIDRSNPIILNDCECPDCIKKIIKNQQEERTSKKSNTLKHAQLDNQTYASTRFSKVEFTPADHPSTMSINIPQCYKCNCPKLVCECDIHVATGVLTTDCSEGPFICRWVKDTDEDEIDPCIFAEDHECPVDCDDTIFGVNSDCECEYEDCDCECDCETISEESDYSDKMSHFQIELEEEPSDEFMGASIDMTPMYLRKPHPAFDCCRVAPKPSQKKSSPQSSTNSKKNNKSRTSKQSISTGSSSRKSREEQESSKQYQSVVNNLNQVMKALF